MHYYNKIDYSNNNQTSKNYYDLLVEKDKEIEMLKNELNSIKNKNYKKSNPALLSDIGNINENFHQKCLSTCNKYDSGSIFKFENKIINNLYEKFDLFSERSPSIKHMSEFNNFTNTLQNSMNNLTNRNNYSSKNFLEIFNSTNNNKYNNNLVSTSNNSNFTKSQNFIKNKSSRKSIVNYNEFNDIVRTYSTSKKKFSSTFSNFFRKSNKRIGSISATSLVRDGGNCKLKY